MQPKWGNGTGVHYLDPIYAVPSASEESGLTKCRRRGVGRVSSDGASRIGDNLHLVSIRLARRHQLAKDETIVNRVGVINDCETARLISPVVG